jgi:hypothetical protein
MISDNSLSDEDKVALAYYANIEFDRYNNIEWRSVEEFIIAIHGSIEEWDMLARLPNKQKE